MNIDTIAKGIDKRLKICIVTSFLFGFAAHGMALFNKYSFHDDTNFLFLQGITFYSGRWMLGVISKLENILFGLENQFSLPLFNGILSIFCISVTAYIIIDLQEIKHELTLVFMAALLVAFPSIAGLFSYMFTSHYYCLAMLMGIFGTSMILKNRNIYSLVGIMLFCSSIGIYQGYIPLNLSIIALYFINILHRHDEEAKKYWKMATYILLCCVALVGLYFVITKLSLVVKHIELLDYRGISSMGTGTSLDTYFHRLIYCYKDFFFPSMDKEYCMYPGNILLLYRVTVIILAVVAIYNFIRLVRTNISLGILYFISILIFPLCVNFMFFMTDYGVVHSLMVYAQDIPFIALACYIDRFLHLNHEVLDGSIEKLEGSLKKGCIILGGLLIVMYIRYDNACYLKASMMQSEANSYFTTLITQIKSIDGYTDELPVTYVNAYKNHDKTAYICPELQFIQTSAYNDLSSYLNDYAFEKYMMRWCGFAPTILDSAEYEALPEVQEMPNYPDDGSIQIINGTVVVKF